MNNRKKVAVFVSDMYGAMIRETQAGLNEAAVQKGIKLIYFVSFSDDFSRESYDQYAEYDKGDIVSFELPNLRDFDAVILISQSFPKRHAQRLNEILKDIDIPVVNLGGKDENYYSLISDDKGSFSDVVEHVVSVHGCKNVYHLAGPKDRFFTFDRIDAYKEVLTNHGLPCGEERIFYGNLWLNCAGEALDYFLADCEKNGHKCPDAIVCANDYMAIGIVDACRERGIEVPKDVIVTGFDGVETATLGYPSITTSSQPFYEFGKKCIDVLECQWNDEPLDPVITAKGVLHCNQSCGCTPLDVNRGEEIRQVYSDRIAKMEYLAQSTTNMILGMSAASSLYECFKAVERSAKIDTGFNEFLLCLDQDWDKQKTIDDSVLNDNREITVVAGFRGDDKIENQTISKKDLLPADMLADPKPYYIFSLHHLQYYMGYLIVSPNLEAYNQLTMKSWLVNLGSMLENWRIRRDLEVAVGRLENLYNRDMLTGLYNRRGYEQYFDRIYGECRDECANIAVITIDMDRLKYVNDNFGHAEGDYCICTIADALTAAADHGEIGFRTGGDEFVVLGKDYSVHKSESYIAKVRDYIEYHVKTERKPYYPLLVSVGVCIQAVDNGLNVSAGDMSERMLKVADDAMYKEKSLHKEQLRK